MILILLGMIDIFSALVMLFPSAMPVLATGLGILLLAKGAVSVLGSLSAKYLWDFMGLIDILAGICLFFEFSIPFLWLFLLVKGVISVFSA